MDALHTVCHTLAKKPFSQLVEPCDFSRVRPQSLCGACIVCCHSEQWSLLLIPEITRFTSKAPRWLVIVLKVSNYKGTRIELLHKLSSPPSWNIQVIEEWRFSSKPR